LFLLVPIRLCPWKAPMRTWSWCVLPAGSMVRCLGAGVGVVLCVEGVLSAPVRVCHARVVQTARMSSGVNVLGVYLDSVVVLPGDGSGSDPGRALVLDGLVTPLGQVGVVDPTCSCCLAPRMVAHVSCPHAYAVVWGPLFLIPAPSCSHAILVRPHVAWLALPRLFSSIVPVCDPCVFTLCPLCVPCGSPVGPLWVPCGSLVGPCAWPQTARVVYSSGARRALGQASVPGGFNTASSSKFSFVPVTPAVPVGQPVFTLSGSYTLRMGVVVEYEGSNTRRRCGGCATSGRDFFDKICTLLPTECVL
jgi:hypothetical protein